MKKTDLRYLPSGVPASTPFNPLSNNDIEAPKALDVQLRDLHIEPTEANFALAAILNGGKKNYYQY